MSAQSYVRDGKVFSAKEKKVTTDLVTDCTWNDDNGESHTIYLHQYVNNDKRGEWTSYIIIRSKKSGKEYKKFLPDGEQIAKDIRGLADEGKAKLQSIKK